MSVLTLGVLLIGGGPVQARGPVFTTVDKVPQPGYPTALTAGDGIRYIFFSAADGQLGRWDTTTGLRTFIPLASLGVSGRETCPPTDVADGLLLLDCGPVLVRVVDLAPVAVAAAPPGVFLPGFGWERLGPQAIASTAAGCKDPGHRCTGSTLDWRTGAVSLGAGQVAPGCGQRQPSVCVPDGADVVRDLGAGRFEIRRHGRRVAAIRAHVPSLWSRPGALLAAIHLSVNGGTVAWMDTLHVHVLDIARRAVASVPLPLTGEAAVACCQIAATTRGILVVAPAVDWLAPSPSFTVALRRTNFERLR